MRPLMPLTTSGDLSYNTDDDMSEQRMRRRIGGLAGHFRIVVASASVQGVRKTKGKPVI
jgi:hypothetical protein